ncbi:hypothetical protein KJ780_02120, partial [Candidatus Micrarchaeota archaeon]|nr:hypothetical protein [Candidatus Micrarchaeota archaeon]
MAQVTKPTQNNDYQTSLRILEIELKEARTQTIQAFDKYGDNLKKEAQSRQGQSQEENWIAGQLFYSHNQIQNAKLEFIRAFDGAKTNEEKLSVVIGFNSNLRKYYVASLAPIWHDVVRMPLAHPEGMALAAIEAGILACKREIENATSGKFTIMDKAGREQGERYIQEIVGKKELIKYIESKEKVINRLKAMRKYLSEERYKFFSETCDDALKTDEEA